jgi:hypothetical protein
METHLALPLTTLMSLVSSASAAAKRPALQPIHTSLSIDCVVSSIDCVVSSIDCVVSQNSGFDTGILFIRSGDLFPVLCRCLGCHEEQCSSFRLFLTDRLGNDISASRCFERCCQYLFAGLSRLCAFDEWRLAIRTISSYELCPRRALRGGLLQ